MRASSAPERAPRLGLLAAVVLAAPAFAEDTQLIAAVGVTRDDNVFRLGSGEHAADVRHVASLGLHVDLPVSSQHIVLDGLVSDYRYARFSDFDHTAYTAQLAWQWQAGARTAGRLAWGRESSLTSLANLQAGQQSRVANHLDAQRLLAEGSYGLSSHWRVRTAFERLEHDNSTPEFRLSDMRRDSVEAGVSWVSGSDNRIGLVARGEDATLPNRQQFNRVTVDNSYRQWRAGPLLEWMPAAKSRLQLRGGRLERNYQQLPARNYAAWTWNLSYEWQATGRLTLAALARDDLSEYEQVNVGLVAVKGFALQPAFQFGEKTRLALSFGRDLRTYLGDLAVASGAPRVRERLRVIDLQYSWQVLRALGVNLALRQESRRSALTPRYDAFVAGLYLRATF
jgi:hypothetical protein